MIRLSTDKLIWDKKDKTFSQEISSLDINMGAVCRVATATSIAQSIEVFNPKTKVAFEFKFVKTDTDGEDVQGWWFESIRLPKLRLLLIND